MGLPVHTPLQQPTGIKMGDGYQTAFAFAIAPIVGFWEKEVKPVGCDGGEAVDTTTMRNRRWRTYAPRHLRTLTEMTANCAYDPRVYYQIVHYLLNVIGSITVFFPEGSSIDFWGYLVKFDPGEHKEGDMPIAAVTIRPTNTDPTTAEQPPVLNHPSGTGTASLSAMEAFAGMGGVPLGGAIEVG